ncbi:MAG: squalene--hopene cyclase [Pirellulales bacterium]|nr:squalene--hopene cyclase [Pirellulales bacterium]
MRLTIELTVGWFLLCCAVGAAEPPAAPDTQGATAGVDVAGQAVSGNAAAPDAVTLENVIAPAPNSKDEPLGDYSLERAARFLDTAALDWQKSRQCFSCHTNFVYLMARPHVSADVPAHAQVRAYAEELVNQRWAEKGPRWDAEVVCAAAFLALNDAATAGKLHPATRTALDRMWTLQREDGGWNWLKCDWPPMESDDHFGVTLAVIGAGVAPEGYAQTEAAQAGLARARQYLREQPPPTLHHRAMLLWASTLVEGILAPEQQQAVVAELLALQRPDGGWALASLGDWVRADGSEQDKQTSDGYGTGFVIYVLRQAGLPQQHEQIQRGVAWLKSHQRASGRWYTRSLHKDSKHFITHAGTAYAVMALSACGESLTAAR